MTTHRERVRRTKALIVDALVTIGEEKSLNQITVSDLTRASGISRGTFYLHYLDKDDFVSQVENELANAVRTILEEDMNGAMNYLSLCERKPYPVVVRLVALADENRALLRFLFGPNGDPAFYLQVTNILQRSILQELLRVKGEANFTPELPSAYALRLIINPIMTVIDTWLAADDGLSQEAVCALIMRALFLSPYEMLALTEAPAHD